MKKSPRNGVAIFDGVAELYDRLRPGYPDQLFEDLIALAGLSTGAHLLEIGPGPGKATTALVARGFAIDAVEPNDGLRAVLQRKMASEPRVRVHGSRFEDWRPAPGELYDALFSAQAFHWIEEATRYRRAADVLKPGGAIALCWIHPDPGAGPLHEALRVHYQKLAPGVGATGRAHPRNRTWEDEIDSSGLFESVFMARYLTRTSLRTADYLDLQRTKPDHARLPEARRRALLQRVGATIESAGGVIDITYRSRLYVARKRNP